MTYLSRFTSHFSHIRFLLPFLAITVLPLARIAATEEKEEAASYFGDWTNDHGDTLQITSDSIQVNEEKPVRYDDITEDSDGSFFVLQIKDGMDPLTSRANSSASLSAKIPIASPCRSTKRWPMR